MQLRDIQYALTVAKELSFSKAAQKLSISQPALSQCIKKLEIELQAPLFFRENNTVKLTSAGELFVREGKEIINKSSRLTQEISSLANRREENLRFGISPFYSNHYLPRIIPAFSKQYPSVKLDILEKHSAVLEELILQDEVDFCLIPLPIAHKEIEYQHVYLEQILLAIPKSHELNGNLTPAMSVGLPFIDLRMVRNEPFIFLKMEQKFTPMGHRLCNEAGFTPHIVFETMNWDTVNALVATGMGVGFVPEILIGSTTERQQPTYCRIMAENTTRSYVAAYKKGRSLSIAAQNFIRIAKNSLPIGRDETAQKHSVII
ncbi:LysR family transcriptional regulator [Cohnella lupini]|uniref:DNA-binding transcriptional LysR family regulator n=1 Tax=Cohnella lupini TaxID=1294267 RepID=A0A3D9I1X3_9BACL|nr:LysR family transcriptional regulator [Cohnella lupini]RED55753.1 DNA-binding transcriptional LysR family regulator [Cohnella lupini]